MYHYLLNLQSKIEYFLEFKYIILIYYILFIPYIPNFKIISNHIIFGRFKLNFHFPVYIQSKHFVIIPLILYVEVG
jgi:hypothetical protein